MALFRAKEPGWQLITMNAVDDPTARRGLWIRREERVVEICGGREGDDFYVKLEAGQVLTPEQIAELSEMATVGPTGWWDDIEEGA